MASRSETGSLAGRPRPQAGAPSDRPPKPAGRPGPRRRRLLLWASTLRAPALDYGVALAATGLALALAVLVRVLAPGAVPGGPTGLILVAVAFSAWWGGLRPA